MRAGQGVEPVEQRLARAAAAAAASSTTSADVLMPSLSRTTDGATQ